MDSAQQQTFDKVEPKTSTIMYDNYVINILNVNETGVLDITNILTGLNFKQSDVRMKLFTFELMEKLLRQEELPNFSISLTEKERKLEIVMKFTASYL